MSRDQDLRRIEAALARANEVLERFTPGEVEHVRKQGGDPLTEADTAIDEVLRSTLPEAGEGWLSEETADDAARLECRRVWIVDPVDGTKEFVLGIPEWSVSVGLVEDGVAVAGGIAIPARGLTVIGALESGVRVNGEPAQARGHGSLDGIEVLASRSEVKRGEWAQFDSAPFRVTAMGSVACKMALVAAGLTDATWTLVPKHEWDVAGGTALVHAAGGAVWTLEGEAPRFNNPQPKFRGLLAASAGLEQPIRDYLRDAIAALTD